MTEQAKPKSAMQKFRQANRRFEYFPTAAAISAIERLRRVHPDAPARFIIDELIAAGAKALFPEMVGNRK